MNTHMKHLAQGAAVAAIVFAATLLVSFDPTQIDNPHEYAIALLSGMVRAAAGYVAGQLTAGAKS